MTRRERILAAAKKQRADRLPFFHYWRHSQIGWAERECRNRGMGMNWVRPPYTEKLHGVEVTEKRAVVEGRPVIRRTYRTPLGSVSEDEFREPGAGQWHAMRSWKGNQPWISERLIKNPSDYRTMKYIVEHTEYVADYLPIEQALDWLGEEGADFPELVEDLYRALAKSREPLYGIAARSPAPIALCGDNIDGVLVNPRLFQTFFMPEYEKQAKVLHEHGKLMAVHMDGRIGILKDLIAETPIDIIEALHPPPMGDLGVSQALSLWSDKAIWLGFPGSIYALGPQATQEFALQLLGEIGAGDRVAMAMSTENQVSNDNLRTLTAVLEQAELPLTRELIERIEQSLA